MDDRRLRRATERWVEAGLIDGDTAESIRSYEQNRNGGTSRRVSTILAGMGAALIGAGILVYLGANWENIPTWLRTVVLVGIPIGFAGGGLALDRRGVPRAGVGMWILAIVAIGPSVGLLVDLYAPSLDIVWPLLAWGLLAVPMGHAFRTRLGTGIGLLALLAGTVLTGAEDNGLLLAGLVATLLLGAVLPLRDRATQLVETYQFVGTATILGLYLWLATLEGRFDLLQIEFDAGLALVFLLAVIVAGGAIIRWRRGRARMGDAIFVLIPPIAVSIMVLFAYGLGSFTWIIGYFLGQAVLLGMLLAIVVLALALGSSILVNLVVVGFFLQILTLLVTITDELSGALTLVLTGIILVIAAVGLERGRRQLLARLETS